MSAQSHLDRIPVTMNSGDSHRFTPRYQTNALHAHIVSDLDGIN